jgi:hypothetical protein
MPIRSVFNDETQPNGFWGRMGKLPTYYQPQDQPNPYRMTFKNGKIKQNGADVHTLDAEPEYKLKDKPERYMFTMDPAGNFYGADVKKETNGGTRRIHHSTMTAGGETAASGSMKIDQGRLESLEDNSGHYQPGVAQTYQAVKALQRKGVDTGTASVGLTGGKFTQDELDEVPASLPPAAAASGAAPGPVSKHDQVLQRIRDARTNGTSRLKEKHTKKDLLMSANELEAYQPEMEQALNEARQVKAADPERARKIVRRPEIKIRQEHHRKDVMQDELMRVARAKLREKAKVDSSYGDVIDPSWDPGAQQAAAAGQAGPVAPPQSTEPVADGGYFGQAPPQSTEPVADGGYGVPAPPQSTEPVADGGYGVPAPPQSTEPVADGGYFGQAPSQSTGHVAENGYYVQEPPLPSKLVTK